MRAHCDCLDVAVIPLHSRATSALFGERMTQRAATGCDCTEQKHSFEKPITRNHTFCRGVFFSINPEKGTKVEKSKTKRLNVILISPRNETVTSYLLNTISASPHFHHVDKDDIVSACKTYYETVRRSHQNAKPENSLRADVAKSSAQSSEKKKAGGIETECARK
uniref:Uncharacterized protein n=1 Tax=Knipowitschia caucasica TaxID=637954 RepID=A0AAV2MIK2_KNICA